MYLPCNTSLVLALWILEDLVSDSGFASEPCLQEGFRKPRRSKSRFRIKKNHSYNQMCYARRGHQKRLENLYWFSRFNYTKSHLTSCAAGARFEVVLLQVLLPTNSVIHWFQQQKWFLIKCISKELQAYFKDLILYNSWHWFSCRCNLQWKLLYKIFL